MKILCAVAASFGKKWLFIGFLVFRFRFDNCSANSRDHHRDLKLYYLHSSLEHLRRGNSFVMIPAPLRTVILLFHFDSLQLLLLLLPPFLPRHSFTPPLYFQAKITALLVHQNPEFITTEHITFYIRLIYGYIYS